MGMGWKVAPSQEQEPNQVRLWSPRSVGVTEAAQV